MGARITGVGSNKLVIEGVDHLHGTHYDVLPDRIETGTYLVAAAMTGGKVHLKQASPGHLEAVIGKLQEAGAEIVIGARAEVVPVPAPHDL